jgi:hypothetical protein
MVFRETEPISKPKKTSDVLKGVEMAAIREVLEIIKRIF